eukprot:scaffold59983_cov36-Tisochrysis_lutea.AAC.1
MDKTCSRHPMSKRGVTMCMPAMMSPVSTRSSTTKSRFASTIWQEKSINVKKRGLNVNSGSMGVGWAIKQ